MNEVFGTAAAAGSDEALVGVLGILAVFYFIVLFVAFAFAIASYILSSLGLYTIAERRGLRNAWLAWLPIGNAWLLGSVSDQYQYVVKGKITNRRKLLLALNITLVVVYIGWIVCMTGNALSGYMGAVVLGAILGWLAFMAVAIAVSVLTYVSYYDLFRSCQPSNALVYLLLGIFVSVTLPFFVFFIRKKDLGMPPRKQSLQACVEEMMQAEAAPAGETPEETAAEPAEEPAEETTEESAEEPAEEPKEEPTEE